MNNKTLIISIVVFLAGLAVLVPQLPMFKNADEPAESSVTSEAMNQELSEVPQRPDCPEVALPSELPCLGGQIHGEPQGDYTIVSLWAWWCEPCRKELPLFDELAQKHPEYTVVGVHADKLGANGAGMLGELGVDMPSFQDSSNSFAGTLGLPGVVPITVVLDAQGQMVGFLPRPFEEYGELESEIENLIAS